MILCIHTYLIISVYMYSINGSCFFSQTSFRVPWLVSRVSTARCWGPPWRRFFVPRWKERGLVTFPLAGLLVFLEIAVLRESPHLYEGRNRPYVVLAISCIYGGEFPTKIIIQTIQKIFAHFFLKYKNARGGICVRTSSKSIIYIYILYILHFCQKIFKICLISNARSQQKSSILRPPRFTDDLL